MDIRYLCSGEDGRTNALLSRIAERASAAGIVLAGTVRPADPSAPGRCHIVLGLLPDGERRDIGLDLGPGATACRLDAGALEEAALVVRDRLPAARGLIVNKFGKQEAAGRGLVGAIADARDRGLPVLVGVPPAWRAAFLAFVDGAAAEMAADEQRILDWLSAACATPAACPAGGLDGP